MKYIKPTSLLLGLIPVVLASCQDMNSAMTPKSKVLTDDFDGSQIVRQEPVSSSASITEDWHILGFEYRSSTPDRVFVTAGVHGINNAFGLPFNIGGRTIQAEEASLTTEYGSLSTRRFHVSYKDFITIATAPMVKMKVSGANSYGVSSFGTSTKALVNMKFPPFLERIQTVKSS